MILESIKERMKRNGFAQLCGIELLEACDGHAKGRIVLGPQHGNPIGSVHGGCIFTLLDSIGGAAFASTGKMCTTLTSTIDYLKGAIGSKELIATASPVRIGNHIAVYDVEIRDDRDWKIARGSVTFYVLEHTAADEQPQA